MDVKKNKILNIALIVAVVLFAAGQVKDLAVKSIVTTVASSITGAPIHIGGFSLGVIRPAVHIKDFKMYNPKGFPGGEMVNIPRISVHYNPLSIFKGKIHLSLLVFDLREMMIVKNKDGKLNFDELKFAQEQAAASEAKKGDQKKSAQEMPMQIDKFMLNLGRVIVKDYTKPENPSILVYELGLKDRTFENLTSAQQLAAVITLEGMKPAAIKSAATYAAATILGVGFFPAAVVGAMVSKDSAEIAYHASVDAVFKAVGEVVKKIGEVKSEDKAKGEIKAKAEGCDLTIAFKKDDRGLTNVKVAARQFMLPKPEVAGGILYRVSERIK
ncbi:MAG TPA: AsmA family protein [Candidatus Omnitrophota bacterium]|nr:AsmA family protein [Candidatus Omnitrophota bacterium]HPD84672.1 AsmA family protein [Candidatus Omnitrophota bacterium]HRZ03530.1 AsmA family protein [Candidatus Omnitrophota bacterium]